MKPPPEVPGDASGPIGPERPWSAGPVDPDDPLLLDRLGLVLPDDARELDGLRRKIRREERRDVRDHANPATGRAAATGIAISVLLLACTVALTGALTALITPGPPVTHADGLPIAQTVGEVGTVGGLLPDAGALLGGETGIALRTLRPAVLFVPRSGSTAPCADCGAILQEVAAQAAEYGIGVYVVVSAAESDRGRELVRASTSSRVQLVVDGTGGVDAAFGGPSDRLVLVHADGVVGAVLADPSADERLEPLLVALPKPGATNSGSDLRPSPLAD